MPAVILRGRPLPKALPPRRAGDALRASEVGFDRNSPTLVHMVKPGVGPHLEVVVVHERSIARQTVFPLVLGRLGRPQVVDVCRKELDVGGTV